MTGRIGISLPDDVLADVKAAVARGEAASVSAYVADALRERAEGRPLMELLGKWYDELESPSDADYDWARQALGRFDV